MGIRRGSISTPIIVDGLMINHDAANRASYIPDATTTYNTIDLSKTGTFINSPTFVSSTPSWDFDGTDTSINCSDYEMDGFTGFAVEAWFKSDSTNNQSRRIVSKDQVGVPGAWILWTNSSDLKFQAYDGGWVTATYSAYSEDSNWHHVIANAGGGRIDLYLDGVNVAFASGFGSLDDADNEVIAIGADSDTSSPEHVWYGQIANVRVYNRGLEESEILHNYTALKGRFGL
jgi:hypothetical protein